MNYYSELKQIKTLMLDITQQNATTIISLIKTDIALERDFFQLLSKPEWLSWLKPLFEMKTLIKNENNDVLYWPPLDYLEKLSKQTQDNPWLVKELLDVIQNLVSHSTNVQKINNYHIWGMCIRIISNIPAKQLRKQLKLSDFKKWLNIFSTHSMSSNLIVGELGNKFLPHFFEDDFGPNYRFAETILDFITQVKKKDKKEIYSRRRSMALVSDSYWVRESFAKQASVIGQKCSVKYILRLANRLKTVLKNINSNEHNDLSGFWIKSLEHPPANVYEASEVLTLNLKDVFLSKCQFSVVDGQTIIKDFLSDKYLYATYKRLVLLAIDKQWDNYHAYLEPMLNEFPWMIESNDCEWELHTLCKNHASTFPTSLNQFLDKEIKNGPSWKSKMNKSEILEWQFHKLSPLRESLYFKRKYEQINIGNIPPYEPARSRIIASTGHKSPLTHGQVRNMIFSELVKTINEFKGADRTTALFDGVPDEDGLADIFEAVAKESPKFFLNKLNQFNVKYFYIHSVMRGLLQAKKEAGEEKDPVPWEPFLDFFQFYFAKSPETIINDEKNSLRDDRFYPEHLMSVDDFAELVETGSKDGNKAFEIKDFERVYDIYERLFPLLKVKENPDTQRDAVTYSLNTSPGRIIRSLISFSLRVSRANNGIKEPTWGYKRYERYLSRGIEGYVWLGCYLPQIHYLDSGYAKEKILAMLNHPRWKYFMEGYLFGANVYEDIYKLMTEHYKKAITSSELVENEDQKLVQHIAVGFLIGVEPLEQNFIGKTDSLFLSLLQTAGALNKERRWGDLVDYFWSLTPRTATVEDSKSKITVDQRDKIISFWRWAMNDSQSSAREILGDKYNNFLGSLSKLTILLEDLDEESSAWLLASAPFVQEHHFSPFFVEYLARFDGKENLKYIGKIFLKLLSAYCPTYDQEWIKILVEKLYDGGFREDADEICNTYGRNGYHFLKDLWDENNPDPKRSAL